MSEQAYTTKMTNEKFHAECHHCNESKLCNVVYLQIDCTLEEHVFMCEECQQILGGSESIKSNSDLFKINWKNNVKITNRSVPTDEEILAAMSVIDEKAKDSYNCCLSFTFRVEVANALCDLLEDHGNPYCFTIDNKRFDYDKGFYTCTFVVCDNEASFEEYRNDVM